MDDTGTTTDLTHDQLLDGRLILTQPRTGHRAGHEALLLAASVPAAAGMRALDLGAGVGTAGLALARRVPLSFLTLVDIDPDLIRLADRNIRDNGFEAHARALVMDASARGTTRAEKGLLLGEIDCLLMNPPFHDPARSRRSPNDKKALAHAGGIDLLDAWLRTAAAIVRPGGSVSLIHRADDPLALLAPFRGRFGNLAIRPVHARLSEPAIRLIVTGIKGSRAPSRILAPIVLQDEQGNQSALAARILRAGLSVDEAMRELSSC